MEKSIKHFECYVVIGLLGMMVIVVLLGTVELGVILVEEMLNPPRFILLNVNEMLKVFGFFWMILIGLELIEVIKVYLVEESIHVEVVFLVAIIAMTRKIIILDVKSTAPLNLIGVAALIMALSVGYYTPKKVLRNKT
ncbi:MAG: phosphate-starvation-inducible E-like protein [Proteobacteria bacterium]|nr:phosphate-starvation-inducible E-like protein [Pseudomonadota bacterium]NIS69119.1 phosphate-starvation-inducible E-like protein [Pseudomonadota bacterium]